MNKRIAITTTSFAEHSPGPLELLQNKGYEVAKNSLGRKLDKREILNLCKGCVGIVAGTEEYDEDILKNLAGLKVISRCGAGMENVSMDSAKKMGVKVFNTPDGPTLAVAELTVGLMIALLRNVTLSDADMRRGAWKKRMGSLLCDRRVGIIGFGRIGKKVAQLLGPFGVETAYADPVVQNGPADLMRMPFEKLIAWADIITIHASSSDEIMGKKELGSMKKGSWLLNLSRGAAVNERALYEVLKTGRLAGAALDVFGEEPYKGPLKELDNVILTPHIGSYAKEARIEMEKAAVENLLKGLKGEKI